MRHSPDFHRQLRLRQTRRRGRGGIEFGLALTGMIAAGAWIGFNWNPPGSFSGPVADAAPASRPLELTGPVAEERRVSFGFCHIGGGTNCVVDGDTFWMMGEKIRVADIDAPETHPPRCAEEARLGKAATERFHALLNDGPVALEIADRDTDRYGRKLRIVTRGGKSLGDQLVSEGLARRWTGRRQPWC